MCWVSSSNTLSADCGVNSSEPSNLEYSNWAIGRVLYFGSGRRCHRFFALSQEFLLFGTRFVRRQFAKDRGDQLRQAVTGDRRDSQHGAAHFLVELAADFFGFTQFALGDADD